MKMWFEEKRGRPPNSQDEVHQLWYEEFFRLNPAEAKRRDLVVDYAERRGGAILEFLKLEFPQYWSLPRQSPPLTLAKKAQMLGSSEAVLKQMLLDMVLELRGKWPPTEFPPQQPIQ
jgi:hypothetical protein